MKYLSLLLVAFGWLTTNAQENPASALNLTLTDYLANTTSGSGCTFIAGSLGTSGSGTPTCAGVDNNDVWYQFTATTQAAKFTVVTSAFDAVVQVLETGSLVSVACANANGANSGEILRVNTLTIGATYFLRIHSSNGTAGGFTVCGQFYPLAEVRPTHSPVPPVDAGLPGYKLTNNCARTQYGTSNPLIQAARWYFTDTGNGDDFFLQVAGSNTLLQLNAVSGICFGNTYDVRVEVQTDNYWCGTSTVRQVFTEAVAIAEISPLVIGQTFNGLGQLNAQFVGTGNVFQWRFTTDNGATQFTVTNIPNTTILLLQSVACLRYNRIYTIEARVQYCGIWGPWSEPGFIFTSNVPYVNLRPEFCGTVQTTGSYISCEFTPNVNSYAWQFAPVEPGDPTMSPIGPAIVTFTPTTTIYLLPIGLTPGTTYRVGTKAIFGLTDGCGTPQEGDYGNFCTITIFGPSSLVTSDDNNGETGAEWLTHDPSIASESNKLTLYPNPLLEGNLNIVLPEVVTDGLIEIDIFDLSGRRVYTEVRGVGFGAQLIQLPRPHGLQPGHYLLNVRSPMGTSVARFVAQ